MCLDFLFYGIRRGFVGFIQRSQKEYLHGLYTEKYGGGEGGIRDAEVLKGITAICAPFSPLKSEAVPVAEMLSPSRLRRAWHLARLYGSAIHASSSHAHGASH